MNYSTTQSSYLLLRRFDIQEYGYSKERNIRNPYSQQSRHDPIHGKSGGHGGKITYNPLNARPIPRFIPMPPLTFREESETPINVITKTDMAVEKRL